MKTKDKFTYERAGDCVCMILKRSQQEEIIIPIEYLDRCKSDKARSNFLNKTEDVLKERLNNV